MAIGTLIGAIGGLILTAYGMYKQEEEAGLQKQAYEKATKTGERQFEAQLGVQRGQLALGRQQLRQQERESRRAWKWKEEERDYSRVQDFVKNFNTVIQNPQQGGYELLNVWSRRAA